MRFIGRQEELNLLREASRQGAPRLTVIYGRRRVGKTRLVEEAFRGDRLIKFEGLEGQRTSAQQRAFLEQLAKASGRSEFKKIRTSDWVEILTVFSDYLGQERAVVFLDEFQWLAAERKKLVSAFKYVWDNYFQKRNLAHFILCGSISSFIVKKVIRSKALYGRVNAEIHLKPLSIHEVKDLLVPARSVRELLELYLSMGGIPQYLDLIDLSKSARQNMAALCFSKGGYLVYDFERIFTSHFGRVRSYKDILLTLAKKGHASREHIQKACRIQSGGRLTNYLEELELADFIEGYGPVHNPTAERFRRYRLADFYLLFYFRFIYPSLQKIKESSGPPLLTNYFSDQQYAVWRGLAFESFCYRNHKLIADRLGFGAVRYKCGPWFSRSKNGAQIDMLFQRADDVITLCEVKFQDGPIGKDIIPEVEKKMQSLPNPRRLTIEKILITASPPTPDLMNEGYFHRIITVDELVG